MEGRFKGKDKEWAKVIAQAWSDDDFKKRLFDDPKAVLKDFGINFPESLKVKLVEDPENELTIPFPAKPPELTGGPEELQERVQAGTNVLTMSA
ncbi:NHLP leader peptide family RiPP precursor [Thermodesulfobacteriota bacterium]